MIYHRQRGWELPASATTPEAVFLSRRQTVLGLAALGGAALAPKWASADETIKTADLYPAKRNDAYKLDRPITPEKTNQTYNNFYEFSTDKRVDASALRIRPWTVSLGGLVEKERTFDVDDLIRTIGVEERLYRHRCVEAWSMVIPWIGYSLAELIKECDPLPSAKYVQFLSYYDRHVEKWSGESTIYWPYSEGLRMDEAMNPLALLTFGLYGEVLPNQNGAPVRVVVPWKYGFKSAKAIVGIRFVEKIPPTTWNDLAPGEYGFYSNVNPNVDHPRWSQKTERRIGQPFYAQRRTTLMFNGYADQVAGMYAGMDLKKNY